MMSSRCDKCGREVASENDVRVFDSIRFNDPDIATHEPRCHLLPVVKNGKVVCPGSPSRAKYLTGYRTVKVFFLEHTTMIKYGFAYKQMQRLAAASETVRS